MSHCFLTFTPFFVTFPFQSNKNYFQNTLHFGKPEIMDYGSAFQLANIVGSLTHLPVIAAESGKANYQLLVLFYT